MTNLPIVDTFFIKHISYIFFIVTLPLLNPSSLRENWLSIKILFFQTRTRHLTSLGRRPAGPGNFRRAFLTTGVAVWPCSCPELGRRAVPITSGRWLLELLWDGCSVLACGVGVCPSCLVVRAWWKLSLLWSPAYTSLAPCSESMIDVWQIRF